MVIFCTKREFQVKDVFPNDSARARKFGDMFCLLLTRARGGRHNQKELLERPCAKVSCREKESIMLPRQSVDRYLMLGLQDLGFRV